MNIDDYITQFQCKQPNQKPVDEALHKTIGLIATNELEVRTDLWEGQTEKMLTPSSLIPFIQ